MKTKRVLIFLSIISMVAFKASAQDLNSIEVTKEALIYPNPLTGEKFTVKSGSVITKIEVVNVIGKVINRTENTNFDLKEISVTVGKCEKGLYFVKITFDDKNTIVRKLLVK